jgi:hypothetical protein
MNQTRKRRRYMGTHKFFDNHVLTNLINTQLQLGGRR